MKYTTKKTISKEYSVILNGREPRATGVAIKQRKHDRRPIGTVLRLRLKNYSPVDSARSDNSNSVLDDKALEVVFQSEMNGQW